MAVLLGAWSSLSAEPTVLERANLAVQKVRLIDNGDNDGFADPNETVQVFVTLRNRSGMERQGIVVQMASTDATVACIPTPVVSFGSLLAGEVREASVPLVVRMANVTRLGTFQDLPVTLTFVVSGNNFNTTTFPQSVTLDVDLNVTGGASPTTYTEGFEGAGFGSFTTQSLDLGHESLGGSNGFRCQYNDPDFINSNSYGYTQCFMGAPTPAQNAYDWHVHTTSSPDGGRAYLGNNSLHWGIHSGSAGLDTTHLRQLDAIRTTNPINLGWNGVSPELSLKQEVGLVDCSYFDCPAERTIDRGVVQVQLANSSGMGQGNWRTIYPYENIYDSQAIDNYTNCTFDPTDDGNDEDDFFAPGDPNARHGPSSTCFPQFAFARQGQIAFDSVFNPVDIGRASDGPGLPGIRGPGTWVQSKFDLNRYRGQRVRLRFVATSLEIGTSLTWEQATSINPSEADDGWYIDDVRITQALTTAATISVDVADRTGLPACGPVCTSVSASLIPAPTTPECGAPFTLDASGSAADQCPGGALQFRFWDGFDWPPGYVLNEVNAALVQEWGGNAVVPSTIYAPLSSAPFRYAVDVRCSTRPACAATSTIEIQPDYWDPASTFPHTLRFDSKTLLSWGAVTGFDALRGDLDALRVSHGNFDNTVETCLGDDLDGGSLGDAVLPLPGKGLYYLLRQAQAALPACGYYPSWSTGSSAEVPGTGGNRDQDLASDPDTCLDP